MQALDEYFRSETNRRLESIESKVDKLLAFKWQIIGGAGVFGIIGSIIVSLVIEMMKR